MRRKSRRRREVVIAPHTFRYLRKLLQEYLKAALKTGRIPEM